MSETATREDIDEVIDILRDFMKQVDERFTEQEKKYDRLINNHGMYLTNIAVASS